MAAHRTKRPWQGQTDPPDHTKLPQYDEKCYLCPGNKRAGDGTNPKYESTFRFEVCPTVFAFQQVGSQD